MPTLQTFTADTLPSHIEWQLRDFARIVWGDEVSQDISEVLHPPRWNPRYFVLAKGDLVMSSATVLWKPITINDVPYIMYGLGLVLTYPEFRKQGHGGRVVAEASDYIRQQATADMALLQTSPDLKQFYGACGWQHTPKIRALSGDPKNPTDGDSWLMMMFLSDKAQTARRYIEEHPFYLDEHIW